MSKSLMASLRRNLTQAEQLGQEDRAKALHKRISTEERAAAKVAELPDLTKDELLDRARAAGMEGTSSMTKAELLEALEALEG